MATEAQINANRKNAQKSTGPRTEEGKEIVSQNATKHGLCSCKNVIRSESQEEYNIFHDEMIEDLSPAGAMEEMLAERIVNLSWRLKRAEVFQNAVIESISDNIFYETWEGYRRAQQQAKEGDMSLLLGVSIRRDFADSRILEQLLVYERRIERSLYKATAEFRKMQKLRQKQNEETGWAEAHSANAKQLRKERETIEERGKTRDERSEKQDEGGETINEENQISDKVLGSQTTKPYTLNSDLKKQSQSAHLRREILSTKIKFLNERKL